MTSGRLDRRAMRWGILPLLLAALSAASARADEVLRQPIRIATEGAYPPFNYAENNEPAGFEVELGRALCVAMKVSCTIVLQDWDGMIAGLKEHRYDAIMSSMEITPERRQRIAFSKRYYQVPSALIGPLSGAPAPDPGKPRAPETPDLAGRSVGTTADSAFSSYLEDTRKDTSLKTYDKIEEAELDLLTGRIDYVLGDKLALRAFLDSREGAGCCRWVSDMPVDRGEGIGVGLRKGDPALRDAFDKAIDAVQSDGTYDRIRAKYFPFDIK